MATRKTDPWTSHLAGASVRENLAKTEAILQILKTPMTDEEMVGLYLAKALADEIPWASPSGLRTLRNRLWKQGLVVDTKEVRITRSNRQAIIWKKA